MLPARHLPALATAERAMGRLDAALADPAARARHTPDALRRGVLASLHLDGVAVAAEDLVLMAAAPDAVAPGARTAGARGVDLIRLASSLDTGRLHTHTRPRPDAASDRTVRHGFAAAGLRDVLEGLALLDAPAGESGDAGPQTAEAPGAGATLRPWSPEWALAAFQDWLAVEGRPDTLHDAAADAVAEGLRAVDRALAGAPGLVGAARALLHLHHRDDPPLRPRVPRPDPFENPMLRDLRESARAAAASGFWATLARLAAPALLRRACGLDHAHLPLAAALATAPAVFRVLLAGPEDEAVGWLLARIANQAGTELDVLAANTRRDAARRESLAGHRRDAGALALLDHLWRDPVLTVRGTATRLAVSERAARNALAVLLDAGILRAIPAWPDGDAGTQAASRPLAYKVTGHAAAPARPAVHRRRPAEPPAGTPMLWQPIATAPRDGKRCLVWAGRPEFAACGPAGADAPVWRQGRRALQPTHWLPVVPPEPPEAGDG
jgi:hypothetical protein